MENLIFHGELSKSRKMSQLCNRELGFPKNVECRTIKYNTVLHCSDSINTRQYCPLVIQQAQRYNAALQRFDQHNIRKLPSGDSTTTLQRFRPLAIQHRHNATVPQISQMSHSLYQSTARIDECKVTSGQSGKSKFTVVYNGNI